MESHLQEIYAAREAIRGVAVETPLLKSHILSDYLGYDVYLKLESLQVTGAFKIRGCYNRVRKIPRDSKGIIAASSGSHGIASALAARTLGIPATVVMPAASPEMKRKRVKGYGAGLVIHGQTYDDAYELAKDRALAEDKVFVPSFDNMDIIHGQGTIAMEVVETLPDFDFMAMPVGGGGLYAGMLLAMKALKPEVPVWGVQALGAPSMALSYQSGRIERLASISTIADAIAVKAPGKLPFDIIQQYGDGIATVPDSAIMQALGQLALWAKVIAEPAAAAALAVDWPTVLGRTPKAAVFIVSGGNVSLSTLHKAMESVEEWPTELKR